MQNTHSKIKKLEKWAGDIHKRTLGDEVALLVFPSHKIIVLKPVFSGNPVEDQLGGVKHSWDHYMCHVVLPYPSPPPHIFTCLICGEIYMGTIPPYTVLLSFGHVTHWFSWHHHHHHQHHLPSSSYPEKD